MGRCVFVFVLVAVVAGFGETIVLIYGVLPGIEIADLLLDFTDLCFVLLLLPATCLICWSSCVQFVPVE